jgi:hypothetical protein
MLKLRTLLVLTLLLVTAITHSVHVEAATNNGFVAAIKVEPLKALLLPSESTTFMLTGEYSKKPIETNEIKPGNPEWVLIGFSSDKNGVTLNQTDGIASWSTTNTRLINAKTTTLTNADNYKLTFIMQVRFPKIKKSDNTQLVINGQKQYFGPYTCSATADLKVIKIIIKRRVAGQGDWVTISDIQNVPSVIVGQKIELKVEVKPDNTDFTNVWTITGGNPIKDYQPTNEKAEVKNLTNTDYSKKTITYYYTAGGNTTVKATVTVSERLKEKDSKFVVTRPQIDIIPNDRKTSFRAIFSPEVHTIAENNIKLLTAYWYPDSYTLPDGLKTGYLSANFLASIKKQEGLPGKAGYCQLVKSERMLWVKEGEKIVLDEQVCVDTKGKYLLDGMFPYKDYDNNAFKDVSNISLDSTLTTNDNPKQAIEYVLINQINRQWSMEYYHKVTVKDEFKMYLMYKPHDDPNGIWVTLGIIEWQWGGISNLGIISNTYITTGPILGTESDVLPQWEKLISVGINHNR